jgi:hypothetical protein
MINISAKKRPVIITIICIVGILWSLINFVFVFSPFVRKTGDWAPAIYGTLISLQFISFVGVWHTKRWGVLLYIFTFFSKIIFSILLDDVSYAGIIFSFVFIIFFLIFYNRMGEEL